MGGKCRSTVSPGTWNLNAQGPWVTKRVLIRNVRILPFQIVRLSVVCLSVRALTKVPGTLAEILESSDTCFKTPCYSTLKHNVPDTSAVGGPPHKSARPFGLRALYPGPFAYKAPFEHLLALAP